MTLSNMKNSEIITGSMNIEVMNRIMKALCDDTMKITNLAMFCKLNHNTCKKYLQLMNKFGWIVISNNDKNILVKLTDSGRKIYAEINN